MVSTGLMLSILIITVFERDSSKLIAELNRQIGKKPVELLVLSDNRRRTLGEKRNALLRLAKGEWIVQLDDDDWICEDFVDTLLAEIDKKPDANCISYDSECTLIWGDNPTNPFRVRCSTEFENEQVAVVDGKWIDITRKPWFWCAWRRDFAAGFLFPEDGRKGDDWYWLSQFMPHAKEVHLDKVMYYYRYVESQSLCNTEFVSGME